MTVSSKFQLDIRSKSKPRRQGFTTGASLAGRGVFLRRHPKCADRNSLTRCLAPRRVGVRSLQEARLLLITDRGTRYSLSSPSLILFRAPSIGAHTFVQYQENFHGYRYRQVVQRQQGFWLHHA